MSHVAFHDHETHAHAGTAALRPACEHAAGVCAQMCAGNASATATLYLL